MRWLFLLLIAAFVVGDIFGLGMSLMTGVSVKNALLYAILFMLVFRVALAGDFRFELPSIHLAFFLLIAYATLAWIAAFAFVKYSGYHMVEGLITLKTRLVDPAIMLLAAFYGLRTMADAKWVLGVLMLGIGAANFATIADTAGIIHFGMKVGDHGPEMGRVFGAFGHANDTGSLIVCVLPAMIAMMITNQGAKRIMWFGCMMASSLVLILTVSRGAFVGLFVGTVWGAWLCRRYVPVQRLAMFGVVALVGVVLAIAVAGLLDPQIGNVISERLFGQSKAYDMGEASSGRTAIWAEAISRMARSPMSFLSGFGWDVYSVMPFRYAPHNHYLGMWFDLGVPGLALFVFLLSRIVSTVRRAVPAADEETRPHLIAFVFGMLALAIAIVFADLFDPWSYIWLYVGVMLRMAVLVRATADEYTPSALHTAELPLRVIRDAPGPFGGTLAGRPR